MTDEELTRLRFDYEAAAGLSLPFATKEAAASTAAYFEDIAGRAIAALRASRAEVAELEAEVDRCHEELLRMTATEGGP